MINLGYGLGKTNHEIQACLVCRQYPHASFANSYAAVEALTRSHDTSLRSHKLSGVEEACHVLWVPVVLVPQGAATCQIGAGDFSVCLGQDRCQESAGHAEPSRDS